MNEFNNALSLRILGDPRDVFNLSFFTRWLKGFTGVGRVIVIFDESRKDNDNDNDRETL